MKNFINKLISSLDNSKAGFSGRKLTAMVLVLLVCYIHYKYIDKDNCIEAMIIDLSGVMLCLGLVTAEQVIKLKGTPPTPPTQ